jgi:hypothetical protein
MATITCGPDAVRLDSASVTMDLANAAPANAATATAAPPATAGPATAPPAQAATAPPAGGQLAISQSGAERTDACGGRSVSITGSANHINLTGDCPRVEIVGSSNTVDVERVDAVAITGSFEHVTWHAAISRAQPVVSTSGVNDVVAKG